MEGDDIEMSEMELQEWIKEEVNKSQLFSPDVLEKCNILQSHLERREKRAARLLKLCESVAACEAIVRKQYSLLGWEYTDTHSEVEGDKVTNCGSSPQTVCGSVQCDTQDRHSSATSKLRYSERLNDNYRKMCSNVLKRKPVVVLTRLPAFKIRSLYPSTAEQHSCENEPLSSLDFDVSDSTPNSNTENASNAMKTRTSRENLTSDAKDSRKPSPPAANTNSNVNNSGSKTLMPGATRNGNATTENSSGGDSRDSDSSSSSFRTGSKNKRKSTKNNKTFNGGTETVKTQTSRDNSTSDAKDSTKPSPPTANTNSNVNNGSKTLMPGATRSGNATTKNSSGGDSSDPDYSSSSVRTRSKNKRKSAKNNKTFKDGATQQAKSNTEIMKTRTSQDNSTSDGKDGTKPSPPAANTNRNVKSGSKTLMPGATRNGNATTENSSGGDSRDPDSSSSSVRTFKGVTETLKTQTSRDNSTSDAKDSTKPSIPVANTNSNVNNGSKTLMPGATRSDNATTKTTNAMCDGGASTPQTEISVDTLVLARTGEMTWQRGQIKEIHTKEDGRVKYKVVFENKGKRLVSGHHIAIYRVAAVGNLSMGTRVVIKRPDDQVFCPGILAELPDRKNRQRFLVFTDDQGPYYVSLQSLYQVYKPLPDPLDDIINEDHRTFLKEYLKNWPCTHQTNYLLGQIIRVELNGSLQKCEVQVLDSSVMQVFFQNTKQKEWLYRGSSRLEHMINRKRELTKN